MRIKTSLMAVFCAFCSCLAIASPAVAGGITLGSKSAPLRAIEYIRYGCKDCAEYRLENIERMQELVEEGSVHLTIRAVPGIKQEVRPVALGLCVFADQGIDAYWAVEKQFFERNREWRSSDDAEATRAMLNIAQSAGYSEAEYEDCLRRDEVAEEIKQTGASLRENNVRVFPAIVTARTFTAGNKSSSRHNIPQIERKIAFMLKSPKEKLAVMSACRAGSWQSCFDFAGDMQSGWALVQVLCDKESNAQACDLIGRMYSTGAGGLEKDLAKSSEYHDRACALGHQRSCNR